MVDVVKSEAPQQLQPRARTILIVDDEPMVREFARRLLETENHCVIEAVSGQDALRALREHGAEIDGVLLDLSMPGMDGSDLLSELRAFAPDLPVIVHSGYPVDPNSEKFAAWKISGVLQKPYRAARLLEMLRSVFAEPNGG
jgi:two-component system cell cycle sensor histidine kinase/response regulator CckA